MSCDKFILIYLNYFFPHRATRLFCDVYNPQSKTYCKRLQVLCPEHSRDPKVRESSTLSYFLCLPWTINIVRILNLSQILTSESEKLDAASSVWSSGARGWSVRVSSGEERLWADRRILQGLQEEMQQALQLGEAEEGRSGLGASPSGKSAFTTWRRRTSVHFKSNRIREESDDQKNLCGVWSFSRSTVVQAGRAFWAGA